LASSPLGTEQTLSFRHARHNEMDEVHALQEGVLRLGGYKNRGQKEGNGAVMVAMYAGNIVGTGHINMIEGEDHARVECLAVDPQWQGHGIGSELLLELEDTAAERGAQATEIATYDAEAFYRNNGYVKIGSIPTRVGVQISMIKFLAPKDQGREA
jgi:N-acetylglutamate synthase-like GNAT family acetyltransferase